MSVQVTEPRLVRDLSEQEFQERYGTDRFTASVVASRCRYVVQHMSTGLVTQAFSPIIRDWYDFGSVISAPPEQDFALAVTSQSVAVFAGTMSDGVRNTVLEYGLEDLGPGDVLMCNDPYRIGTHVNDTLFLRPVFAEGRIVAFVSIQAHQLDMGGTVPAGFSGTKKNVYENGLVIPPTLLYRGGRPVRSAFSMFLDNARLGGIILPDLMTIHQSLALADRLLLETVQRYGADTFTGSLRYCMDGSADAMWEALAGVPDGVYEGEDRIDADGVSDEEDLVVRVRINKKGGRAEVDLSGTSRQALGSINASALDAKTTIGLAFRLLIDRTSHYTAGSYRHIDVVIPPGTMVSARPPDGTVFLYWESSIPIIWAIFRALRDALGPEAVGGDFGSLSLHNANGQHPDGTPWVSTAQAGGEHGPWGATKHGDADSYNVFYYANNFDPPTEATEADTPVVVLRKEYAPDTAGPGTNRGGAAVRKDTLWRTEAEHYSMPLHFRTPSGIGAYGGGEGANGAVWLFDPEAFDIEQERDLVGTEPGVYAAATPVAGVLDPETNVLDPEHGEYVYFARVPIWHTKPNTIFRYQTNGGGGWGDPLQRDPERVRNDVRDEYLTIAGAAEQYGVVITGDPVTDPEGLVIDADATAARRRAMEQARG